MGHVLAFLMIPQHVDRRRGANNSRCLRSLGVVATV
jgi:hypothetical protein